MTATHRHFSMRTAVRCAQGGARLRGARSRRAFTLLEIVVTLGLLVLILALAWPIMQNQIAASALPESAARLRDTLFMARSHAMMENRRVRIRFAPNEQAPYIEIELDPVRFPGEWEAIGAAWAREPLLLGDVQVVAIESGRPVYLKPVSFDESTDKTEKDAEEEAKLEKRSGMDNTTGLDTYGTAVTMANEDIELDENRPLIIYEPNGSTDWATIKLAEIPLDQELTEDDNQLWVILDGRTGLAYVRDQVTEDQLADETFYVRRENLELPDLNDTSALAFGLNDPGSSGESGGGEMPGGGSGGMGSGGNPPAPPALGDIGAGFGPGDLGQLPAGGRGGDGRGGGRPGMGNGGNRPNRGEGDGRQGGGRGAGGDGRGGGGRGPGGEGRGGDGRGPRGEGGDGRGGPSKDGDVGGGKGGTGLTPSGQRNLTDDMEGSDLSREERDNINNALNDKKDEKKDGGRPPEEKPDDQADDNDNDNKNGG